MKINLAQNALSGLTFYNQSCCETDHRPRSIDGLRAASPLNQISPYYNFRKKRYKNFYVIDCSADERRIT